MFRKFFVAVPIAVVAISGSTACASKKFVRTSVGEVNDKVDSMGRSIEETQERTRRNEGRIIEVDQKAGAAQQSATRSPGRGSRSRATTIEASSCTVHRPSANARRRLGDPPRSTRPSGTSADSRESASSSRRRDASASREVLSRFARTDTGGRSLLAAISASASG